MNDNLIAKELMSTSFRMKTIMTKKSQQNKNEEEQHDENVDMHEVLYKAIF